MSQISGLTSPSGASHDLQLNRPSTDNEAPTIDPLMKATSSGDVEAINFDESCNKIPGVQELKLQGKGKGKETTIKVRTLTSMWNSRNSNNDESESLLQSSSMKNNGLTILDIDEEESTSSSECSSTDLRSEDTEELSHGFIKYPLGSDGLEVIPNSNPSSPTNPNNLGYKESSDVLRKNLIERDRIVLKPSTVREINRKRKASIPLEASTFSSATTISLKQRLDKLVLEGHQRRHEEFPFRKHLDPSLHQQGMCYCAVCKGPVNFSKSSSFYQHINSPSHKHALNAHSSGTESYNIMERALIQHRRQQYDNGVGVKRAMATDLSRLHVCKAFLLGNIGFNCLDDKNPFSLSSLLGYHGIDASSRTVSDLIPLVLSNEIEEIKLELSSQTKISVIFDATPDRGQAFGVVLRWMKDTLEIHHRCISLIFYDVSFNSDQIETALQDALLPFGLTGPGTSGRERIIAFIRDGCSANNCAVRSLTRKGYGHALDIQCISHSANNVGTTLYSLCKEASKFVSTFNTMMNVSLIARSIYCNLITEDHVKRYTGDIRWFYKQEVASQLFKNWMLAQEVVNSDIKFCPELRDTLQECLVSHGNVIILQLALFEDIASVLSQLCYTQEGDDFLIHSTFDHWTFSLNVLKECSEGNRPLPHFEDTLNRLYHDDLASKITERINAQIILSSVYDKMYDDSKDRSSRLWITLQTLRACRLLDFNYIGQHPILCLYDEDTEQGELIMLHRIPAYSSPNSIGGFIHELPEYHRLSTLEVNKPQASRKTVIDFWKCNKLHLPHFTSLVIMVGALCPSSATVERMFSMLALMKESKGSALADYKRSSVMLRYNERTKVGRRQQDEM